MAFAYPGAGALDYQPCRYGASKLVFRGPQRALVSPYIAAVGATETYGKFVSQPYPALIEAATGITTVNLGCVNAGPDAFLNEPEVAEIAGRARVTVLQVPGAQNLSNRFYAVHPRRNDRFLRAEPALRALYPEVDFTEFHFTRHMLHALHATGPRRFAEVADEVRAVWVERMVALVGRLGRVVLLRLTDPEGAAGDRPGTLRRDPIPVDAAMLAALRGHVADQVEVRVSPSARAEGVAGMAFAPFDRMAAAELPGPAAHREIAAALVAQLQRLI
jgi:Domain of unknown function (DUF6473)